MNEQQKLEANMACAKLLNLNPVRIDKGCAVMHSNSQGVVSGERFDIFTNAEQCLVVIENLGNDYDISFCPLIQGGWCYEKNGLLTREDYEFDTLKEAVASAAIEVMK